MPVAYRKTEAGRALEPRMPDVYLPAMWPLDLQHGLLDWYGAWRLRRLYRQLLQLDDRQLAARDLSRARLSARAERPLRVVAAQQRQARLQRCADARR